MATYERIAEAIEGGEVLTIRYHGGSSPGATRQIAPIRFKDNHVVQARCYTSKAVKPFFIDKIEILPPQPGDAMTWEAAPPGTPRKRDKSERFPPHPPQKAVRLMTDQGEVQVLFRDDAEILETAWALLSVFSPPSAEASLLFESPLVALNDPPLRFQVNDSGGATLMIAPKINGQWLRSILIQIPAERLKEMAAVLADMTGQLPR